MQFLTKFSIGIDGFSAGFMWKDPRSAKTILKRKSEVRVVPPLSAKVFDAVAPRECGGA